MCLFTKNWVKFESWMAMTSAKSFGSQLADPSYSSKSSFSIWIGSSIINFGIDVPNHMIEFEPDGPPLEMKFWDSRGKGHFSFWSTFGSLTSLLLLCAQWYPELDREEGWFEAIWLWKYRLIDLGSDYPAAWFLNSTSNYATGSIILDKWTTNCFKPWNPCMTACTGNWINPSEYW